MQMRIANNIIKSTLPGIKNQNAKDFLKLVEENFYSADKALAGTLMAELTIVKFDGSMKTNSSLCYLGESRSSQEAQTKGHHVTTSKVGNGENKEHGTTNENFAGKRDISRRIVLSIMLGSKRK
ncbi:hypothetical protein Tco_0767392, partial [Tanacetum coccineum]